MNSKYAIFMALLVCASATVAAFGVASANHYEYKAEHAPGPADSWNHDDLYLGETDDYDNRQVAWNNDGTYNSGLEHYGLGWKDMYLFHIFSSSPYFDMSQCGATNAQAFGIDRGNDDEGTFTDESLLQAYKNFVPTKHSVRADFYHEDAFAGEPVQLAADDEVVARLTNCYGTPDEEGWYRIWAYANGSKTKGTAHKEAEIQWGDFGHWMYICDCQNRTDAIEKMGGPPSDDPSHGFRVLASEVEGGSGVDQESTPTPDESGGGQATDTPSSSDGTPTPTAESNDGGTNDTPTPTAESNDGGTGQGGESTPASGPGFGAVVAVMALLAAVLAVRTRSL